MVPHRVGDVGCSGSHLPVPQELIIEDTESAKKVPRAMTDDELREEYTNLYNVPDDLHRETWRSILFNEIYSRPQMVCE
jgi:hypothetical protein